MEEVAEKVGPRNYYEVVYVFEALHHAFDWRQAIQSSFECLRPGGWLLICQEPALEITVPGVPPTANSPPLQRTVP